jgi:plastocyanin
MRKTWITTVAIAAALTLALAACGDDEGAHVRTLDDGGSASGSAGGSASASASGSASGVAAAEKECAPVGEELAADADTTVDIALSEYSFDPDAIEVDAGVVTFAATNIGGEAHELAFLPGGGDVPLTDDGVPNEEALAEMGAFELEAFGPGQDCTATYELEAGDYTMFCIVEAPDGETHAEKGMVGALTVG